MTSEDFGKVQRLLTNKDIFSFAKRICEKHHFNPVPDYPQTTGSAVMKSAARKQLYMDRAANLMRRAIFLGANTSEILLIAGYLLVLAESLEKSLNYKQYEIDMGIPNLMKKYTQAELLKLETDYDELKQVLDRDKGYYGIAIKEETV